MIYIYLYLYIYLLWIHRGLETPDSRPLFQVLQQKEVNKIKKKKKGGKKFVLFECVESNFLGKKLLKAFE